MKNYDITLRLGFTDQWEKIALKMEIREKNFKGFGNEFTCQHLSFGAQTIYKPLSYNINMELENEVSVYNYKV